MLERLSAAVEQVLSRLSRRPSPRVQRRLMIVAAVLFVAGAAFAFPHLDVDLGDVRLLPLAVLALVGVPLTAVVNALEFAVSGRLLGRRIGMRLALRVSVLSTAANLLPVPGAAIVRIQYLRKGGSTYGQATSATMVMAATWIALSAGAAGGWLLAAGRADLGSVFVAGAGIFSAVGVLLWHRRDDRTDSETRLVAAVIAVEAASVVLGIARLYLVLIALHAQTPVSGAVVIAMSGPLASSVGVVPGGLGIRELIAASLAVTTGLTAALGFTATAMDRLVGTAMHAPFALLLMRSVRERSDARRYQDRSDEGL